MSAGQAATEAAASAAAALVEPGMTIGLGSGRMVWRIADMLGLRGVAVRVVVASRRTHTAAQLAGLEIIELDGEIALDIALDGADEMDMSLRLLKGAGGALLHEKIIASAATRFVVVLDAGRCVTHLGERCRLPVEIATFSWRETRRALMRWTADAELRRGFRGEAYTTDEGNYIVDCVLPADIDLHAAQHELTQIPGVMEHGIFAADEALLGHLEGGVERLRAPEGPFETACDHSGV
jgi:ribose 5-phosphate isomerase A